MVDFVFACMRRMVRMKRKIWEWEGSNEVEMEQRFSLQLNLLACVRAIYFEGKTNEFLFALKCTNRLNKSSDCKSDADVNYLWKKWTN